MTASGTQFTGIPEADLAALGGQAIQNGFQTLDDLGTAGINSAVDITRALEENITQRDIAGYAARTQIQNNLTSFGVGQLANQTSTNNSALGIYGSEFGSINQLLLGLETSNYRGQEATSNYLAQIGASALLQQN